MKKLIGIFLALTASTSVFAASRLSGNDAQSMFDILQRAGLQVHTLDSGESLASAFNLECADDQCTADINFVDPAMGRKLLAAKDASSVKKLLLQVGFKPEVSHVSGSNGVSFLGGANISCEIIGPNGFKECAFQ